ncbi:MAG: DNA polymerase [Gemmatimonadaceae bacterium]|nr:DNA polymerase [Gemmatimonadaceae bacterium]
MKLLFDELSSIPGGVALEKLWIDEACERYQVTEIYNGAGPIKDNDWVVVCTPDRIKIWKGLAPRIWSVPDRVEVLDPLLAPEVWALRIVSGESAGACEKVWQKYGCCLDLIPEKAKKWYPFAALAKMELAFDTPQLIGTRGAYVAALDGPKPYALCTDLPALLARCENAGRFAYDFEFGGSDDEDEEEKDVSLIPVGVSLSWEPGHAEYVPMGHEGYDGNFDPMAVMQLLSGMRAQPTLWNAKADMQIVMNTHDVDETALWFFEHQPDDAMAVSYLLSLTPLGLKKRTWLDYHFRMQPIKELIGEGKKRIPFSRVPIDKAVPYGCQDADWTLRHWIDKWPTLYEAGQHIYEEIERPLTVILAHAQLKGMPFDRAALTDMYAEDAMEKARLEEMIYAIAGVRWNINSNEQTADVLYKRLGLPPQVATASFKPSVGADALYPIARLHPIIPLVLRWSKLNKLESAFYVKLLGNKSDSIHCRLNQFIVETGRLSSSEPNMTQNPDKIRRAFIGAPGLMAADESQLELRTMAKLSQDPGMLAAYMSDPPLDLHQDTMTRTGLEDRRPAKVVNFLTQYGGAATNLQLALWKQGIYWTLRQCQDLLDIFFAVRPRLHPYMREVVEFGEEHGYTETLAGRRRYVPEIHSSKPDERGHAERQLINHPSQGTGSDIVKRAMVQCWKEIVEAGCWMPLQIHDEILVIGDYDELECLVTAVRKAMTEPNPLAPVPLIADIHIAENWGAAH